MKEFLDNSSIKEATGNESALDMVQQLVKDFEAICKKLTEGMEKSENQEDQPTADILIKVRTSLETHIWMFSSFLGK